MESVSLLIKGGGRVLVLFLMVNTEPVSAQVFHLGEQEHNLVLGTHPISNASEQKHSSFYLTFGKISANLLKSPSHSSKMSSKLSGEHDPTLKHEIIKTTLFYR